MITQGQCNIFLLNKLKGAEDFSAPSPFQYYIALYTADADITQDTLIYTTSHEVVGAGYTAGCGLFTVKGSRIDSAGVGGWGRLCLLPKPTLDRRRFHYSRRFDLQLHHAGCGLCTGLWCG